MSAGESGEVAVVGRLTRRWYSSHSTTCKRSARLDAVHMASVYTGGGGRPPVEVAVAVAVADGGAARGRRGFPTPATRAAPGSGSGAGTTASSGSSSDSLQASAVERARKGDVEKMTWT